MQLPRSVVLVGTYPPTACGLATFTSNLRSVIAAPGSGWTAHVVRRVDSPGAPLHEPVIEEWVTGDDCSLSRALDAVLPYDALLLQHEYGIYGGPDGADVVRFVDELKIPLIAGLHTALRDPSPNQRRILDRILEVAAVTVVQSNAARRRLLDVHGLDPSRVVVIPHGAAANFDGPVPDGYSGPVVLTWGLLSPGKGIEHGIRALAALGDRRPAATYVVAGQTHPKVRAARGECYREELRVLAGELGVADRVHFDDEYRDWGSLRALVRRADVVLLPYDSRDQVSSGVLVEALASGKPVVATRFPHAEELLARGAGVLVPHGDSGAMAEALAGILYEPGTADAMAAAARREAVPLLWPAVGSAYRSLIGGLVEDRLVG